MIMTWILLLVAAFFAGALNAVAGGGSFLTLPALVFAGVPPVIANATGTMALLPGYLASAWGFREELRSDTGVPLADLLVVSLVGGAAGALLLLVTPNEIFQGIVPWLMLIATALFGFGPHLLVALRGQSKAGRAVTGAGVLLVAIYGGYFNGGLGIMLLALFTLLGLTDLNAMNGLKNLVSAVLTAIAVSIYAWGGAILWGQALVMMVAATVGGYVGARLARRVKPAHLRFGIVTTGLVMACLFFAA